MEKVKLAEVQSSSDVDVILTTLDRIDQPWGNQDLKGSLSVRKDVYRNDDNTYRCGKIEIVSFVKSGVKYTLNNLFSVNESFVSIAECSNASLTTPYERNYSFEFTQENKDYDIGLFFRDKNEEFTALPEWINVQEKSETLAAAQLVDHLSAITVGWDEAITVDTAYWRKRVYDGDIMIDTDNDNKWVKSTRNEDYTTSYECSTDGITWVGCAG